MILVLDAYNVLKSRGVGDDRAVLKQFIGVLSAYGRAKKHDIYLVFDGYRDDLSLIESGVHIIFAGRVGLSADDEIVDFVRARKGKELCVVTDDRALSSRIKETGAQGIKNDLFWYALGRWKHSVHNMKSTVAFQIGSEIYKSSWSDTSSDFDALMEQSSRRLVVKDAACDMMKTPLMPQRNLKDSFRKKSDEKILKKL